MAKGSSEEKNRRVLNLLELVLELEPALRGAYLETIGQKDPALRQQVAAMLRALGGEGPAAEETTAAETRPSSREMPARVGPYQVVREIGRGGMSRVYLAERADEQFERQVALKVIDQGLEAPIVHQRFLAERQILASFDSPLIAKLFDGGTLPNGRPYLVMELVEGVRVDQYVAETKLALRERIALFRQICQAVSYAHQKLVVHRDLKPSNILVKTDGEPKLLDFGIAKLLDPESFPLEISEATRTHFRPMTPAYASPEQLLGEPITTATDVYALGVLLHQLLTGELPHDGEDRLRQVLRHRAGEVEVPKPSERAKMEAWESHDHRRVARQLRGDLDNVVAKALRPDAKDRYASVAELDEDLRRYLEGEPVRATRETPLYLTGKFLRRYRLPVTVAVLVLALVFGFAVVTQRQAHRIAQERDRANEIRGFLANVMASADSQSRSTGNVSLRSLLDESSLRLQKEPFRDRATQFELLELIGDSYASLGLFRKAVDHYQSALSNDIGDFSNRARCLYKLGVQAGSEGLLPESIGAFNEALSYGSRISLQQETEIKLNLAGIYLNAGEFTELLSALDNAASIITTSDRPNLVFFFRVRADVSSLISTDRETIAQSLTDYLKVAAPLAPRTISTWHMAGMNLLHLKDYDQALMTQRYAYTLNSNEHRRSIGRTIILETIADILLAANRPDEALRANQLYLQRAQELTSLENRSTRFRYQLARGKVKQAEILLALGREREASEFLRAGIEELEPIVRGSTIIYAKNTLTQAYLLKNDLESAKPLIADLLQKGWRRADFLRLAARKGALPDPLPPALVMDLSVPPQIRAYIDSLPEPELPWISRKDLPTLEEILTAEESALAN